MGKTCINNFEVTSVKRDSKNLTNTVHNTHYKELTISKWKCTTSMYQSGNAYSTGYYYYDESPYLSEITLTNFTGKITSSLYCRPDIDAPNYGFQIYVGDTLAGYCLNTRKVSSDYSKTFQLNNVSGEVKLIMESSYGLKRFAGLSAITFIGTETSSVTSTYENKINKIYAGTHQIFPSYVNTFNSGLLDFDDTANYSSGNGLEKEIELTNLLKPTSSIYLTVNCPNKNYGLYNLSVYLQVYNNDTDTYSNVYMKTLPKGSNINTFTIGGVLNTSSIYTTTAVGSNSRKVKVVFSYSKTSSQAASGYWGKGALSVSVSF